MSFNKIIHISRCSVNYLNTNTTPKRCFSKIIRRNKVAYDSKELDVRINSQEEMIVNTVNKYSRNERYQIDWPKFKSEVLENGRKIDKVNFDAMFIGICGSHKNLNAAKSYIKYMYSNNQKPNLGTLGKFLRLYYLCNDNTKLNVEDEKIILNIYENLRKKYPLFDSVSGENIISGISLTDRWKDSLELLDMVKITCKPATIAYSSIAKAAFLNNEDKLGWDILEEGLLYNRFPYPNVYSAWLKTCREHKENKQKRTEKLLNFFADNEIFPTKEISDEILNIFNSLGYKGTYTTIGSRGNCNVCQNNLHKVKVSKKDFEELKKMFVDNVIIGKNIFYKTTPEELENFKDFISKNAPYDIVIDGLNVAYSAGVRQSPQVCGKMLSAVIDHFGPKKVLVLGRLHMNKWPRHIIKKIESKADVFLAQDISQDDPYLLYATMSSGLGTGFVSRDLMRSHSYLLMDNNLRRTFRRWQQLHQYTVIHVNNDGKVIMKNPHKNLSTTQQHKSGWHIPYDIPSSTEHTLNPATRLEPKKDWLCISSQ